MESEPAGRKEAVDLKAIPSAVVASLGRTRKSVIAPSAVPVRRRSNRQNPADALDAGPGRRPSHLRVRESS
jgi:hypothetical protein